MLKRILIAIAASVVLANPVAAAGRSVTVQLEATQTSFASGERVTLNLLVRNDGRGAAHVLRWLAAADGELEDALFVITRNGVPVNYTGPIVKRGVAGSEDAMRMAPGAVFRNSVDLSDAYDFTVSGRYQIQFRSRLELAPNDQSSAQIYVSNAIELTIAGRPNAVRQSLLQPTAASLTFSKCTAAQSSTVTQAVAASSTMANGAVSYLQGAPQPTPRYATWFGAFSNAGWAQAQTQFAAIKDALDSKPLTFDCGCKKKYYAYVFPNKPYEVFLCRAFWTAPLTGTDSKGGTIIHELSHFDVVAGTDDWAYGQAAAQQLAITDPARALNNADSHEYFAENTPFLQ